MSKRLLRQELFSKGIEEGVAEQAIGKEYGPHSEAEVAVDLVRKKIERYRSGQIESRKIRKRISDFLIRRGFNWEVVGEVVRELLPQ